MTIGIKELSQELAKASKNSSQPLSIQEAGFVIKTLIRLMTDELVQPEGRVEVENFLVLHNRPYVQAGLSTRRIDVRISTQLKKRLKANMPK
jgi:hypothetical protein